MRNTPNFFTCCPRNLAFGARSLPDADGCIILRHPLKEKSTHEHD